MGMRMLATELAAAGNTVEVHTTTAESMATWANSLAAGTSTEDGVAVHRHRTSARRHRRFESLSTKVLSDPAAANTGLEARWIRAQGPHSPDLLDAVSEVDSDVIVMSPYLYEPTLYGALRARVPVVIHPASHDEPPLRLPAVRAALEAADGLGFYTDAERRLTEQVIPQTRQLRQMLVGLGVDSIRPDYRDADVVAVKSSLGLSGEEFFLVLGRVDRGKGTHGLIKAFGELHRSRRSTARLVVAGPIIEQPPPTPGVTILGPVDDHSKQVLLSEAVALINPSTMESFSLVLLESWMAGTPVIVNSRCDATVEHASKSEGGLAYSDLGQLGRAVDLLSTHSDLNATLAASGRKYVENWYTWPAILDRYQPFLHQVATHARPAHRRGFTA